MAERSLAEPEMALAEKWSECLALLDTWILKGAEALLRAMKYGAMDRIIITAGRDARLSGYDEKIFAQYVQLMRLYDTASAFYNANAAELHTVSLSTIMKRIDSVLREQVNQFNASWDGHSNNPIGAEKIQIISGGVASFSMRFEELEKTYLQTAFAAHREKLRDSLLALPDEQALKDYFSSYLQETENRLLSFFMEKSYTLYCQAVQSCLYTLNNLHSRAVMKHYYELLLSEQDILCAAIQLQITALEQEVTRYAGNSREQDIAHVFLGLLRECYLFYADKATAATRDFETARDKNEIAVLESLEDLRAAYLEMFANAAVLIKKDFFSDIESYIALLSQLKKIFQNDSDYFRSRVGVGPEELVKNLRHRIEAAGILAEELVGIFCRVTSFYCETFTGSTVSLPESEIIKGIHETLVIKIESLEENKEAFTQKSANLLEHIPTTVPALPANIILPALITAWRKNAPHDKDDEHWQTFYQAVAYESAVKEYLSRVEEKLNRMAEKIYHAVLGLKKDVILYEISTYEEILTYSVSRLRKSETDAVSDYVEIIDAGMRKIEKLLQRNNILMITPKPRDMFNGKEHEVLMAEKTDGFEKGQIVKRMTSGYKMNDKVLIRANVIAAR